MVKKAAVKTAGISMAGFQPRSKVIDGQSPAAVAPLSTPEAGREPGRPYTGVGSVMAAITREAEVSHELREAQARLAELDGAVIVRQMDPKAIRRSEWANRIQDEFSTADFRDLKAEIASAGGNVQPIKVRAISKGAGVIDGQSPTHEIVYGHRRHQACLELGIPVSAIVAEDMGDKQLFEAMDRENRGRKNLSAWEQGRMYEEALRKGLYPSIRKLAESLGVNQSDASRSVQLAKLPKQVVVAFASPLDLQVRWAKPLTDVLQRDPDGVLARAKEAARLGPQRSAVEVFDLLIAKPARTEPRQITVTSGSRELAVMRIAADGRVTVEFELGVIREGQQESLCELLKAHFG